MKDNIPALSEPQTVSPTTYEPVVAGRVNAVMAYSLSAFPEQYKQYLYLLLVVSNEASPWFCSST